MRDTDYGIAQIASEVGYADAKYFSKVFNKSIELNLPVTENSTDKKARRIKYVKKTDLKGSIEIRKYEINSYLKFVFTTILIMCVSLLDLYLLTNKFSGLLLAMFFLLSILFVCQFVHFYLCSSGD